MSDLKQTLKTKTVLTNFDIEAICKALNIPLVGSVTHMKDEIKSIKDGYYVMNLQNSDQYGSHWLSFLVKNKCVYYCDSFGMPPPKIEWDLFLKNGYNVYINYQQIQHIDSNLCGWFAVYFLFCMKYAKHKSMITRFQRYLQQWDEKNLRKNDKVKKLILSYL